MDLLELFPTNIGIFSEEETRKKLLPFAEMELKDKSVLTYEWNYKTTYTNDVKCYNRTDLSFFTDVVKKNCDSFWNLLGYSPIDWNVQVFFSEMYVGDFHMPHIHPNSKLSGVFYLKVPDNSAHIQFYDPRPHRRFNVNNTENLNQYNWHWMDIPPKEGDMLIWESWLEHEVPKNGSKEGRMTAVFNVW